MAFNISDFQSKVSQYGLSRDNLFIVRITPPASLNDIMPMQDLIFFCKSVDLPAISISTVDFQKEGWGKIEKMPASLPYDQLQSIFMVDAGFRVKAFFHRWMQSVINYNSSNSTQSYNGMRPHEIAYKNEYVGTVEVIVYSYGTESISYTYKFLNAFPTNMGNITTSWENNNTIMTVPISFSYDGYIADGFGESVQYAGGSTSYASLGGNSDSGSIIGQIVSRIPVVQSVRNLVDAFTTVRRLF